MSEIPMLKRCDWAFASQLYIDYHDKEWGVPVHDERKLFEMLILEGVQAGLSWSLILKKRAGYLKALDGFDANKIARYDEQIESPGCDSERTGVSSGSIGLCELRCLHLAIC